MENKNPPDERVVYLALKNVFKGPAAKFRQPKIIRKVLTESNQRDIAELVREHNIDSICNIARVLLTDQVFESTLKAKIRFPEVFAVSPAQSAEREASEAEAARKEADAIKDAVQGHQENIQNVIHVNAAVETESAVETCHPQVKAKQPTLSMGSRQIPSLFPIYLPFGTQHRLLVKVQSILEQACFIYGQQAIPKVLQKHQWDCPESAELNLWAVEFLRHKSAFESKDGEVGKSLEELFRSIADIRHTAVHRVRVSAKGIEQFIVDAEALATCLGDPECVKSLSILRRDTKIVIEELERNKHILRSKLADNIKRIAAQRAELDRQEEAAIAEMVKEDGEYQAFAGMSLEQVIVSSEANMMNAAATENEKGFDVDDTDSVGYYEDSVETYEESTLAGYE